MSDHKHDDCGCGHDHDHDHEDDVFVLTDAEGKEHEMIMVSSFEVEEQGYAVLMDRNDPEAEGVIFRIEEENDEAYLVSIEDDAEWQRVVTIYNQIVAEDEQQQ